MRTIRLLTFATDPAGAPADRAAAAVSGPPWAPTPAPNRAALGQARAPAGTVRCTARSAAAGGTGLGARTRTRTRTQGETESHRGAPVHAGLAREDHRTHDRRDA